MKNAIKALIVTVLSLIGLNALADMIPTETKKNVRPAMASERPDANMRGGKEILK